MRRFLVLATAAVLLLMLSAPLFAQEAEKQEPENTGGRFVVTGASFDAFTSSRGAILVTVRNDSGREAAAKITIKRTMRTCVKGDPDFCKGKPVPCEPPCIEWANTELGTDTATITHVHAGDETVVNIPVDNLSCDAEIKVSPGNGNAFKLKIEAKEIK